MNNLLFATLIMALLYYFFYYLPSQKKINPHPTTKLTQDQFTQTDPDPIIEDTLTGPGVINFPSNQTVIDPQEIKKLTEEKANLQEQLKEKSTQITNLQTQVRELTKRPLKPTNSKTTQTDELTNAIDNLIKDIQDLSNLMD